MKYHCLFILFKPGNSKDVQYVQIDVKVTFLCVFLQVSCALRLHHLTKLPSSLKICVLVVVFVIR